MEFGKILKQERNKKNFTQEDLSQKLNVSRSAISNWEIGRNYPDIQTIIDISNILNVSLDYLLKEDINVMEFVDNDLTKKKNIKKLTVYLICLLTVSVGIIIFLLYPKDPAIKFTKEISPKNSEIIAFKKNEIEEAYLDNNKLKVVLKINGNEAGYLLENGDEELTVSFYKINDTNLKQNKIIPYDGIVTIDLAKYGHLKNIYIIHS